jgi:ribosome-binding protein aMBF1 (putative translation factor)
VRIFSTQTKIFVLCSSHASTKEAGRLVQTHKASPKPSTFETERLKIMTSHSSASVRVETPHETETTLKRRAQAVINDTSIDPQWRNIVRYALEINDPLLPDLVRRADAGESIIDTSETLETNEDHRVRDKLEALVDIICGNGGAQAAGALFVLMGTLQNSTEPDALAHAAKHFAFTRCGELNLHGMVDAQLAAVEGELLAGTTLRS